MEEEWLKFTQIDFRCQILAMLMVALIVYDFIRSKRLPLRSTNIFGIFLLVGLFNTVMDIATYFTLLNYKLVPPLLNKILHIGFLGSVEIMPLLLFFYIFFLYGLRKQFKKWQVFLLVMPSAAATIGLCAAPIYYVVDEQGAYSNGPMVYITYAAIVVYIISVYCLIFSKNKGSTSQHSDVIADYRKGKFTVAVGIAIWVVVALVQFFTKYLLISSIGMALMIVYVYLNFENPIRYADEEINTLNRRAFHIMVPEMLSRKKTFWLVSLTIDDKEHLSRSKSHEKMRIVLRTFSDKLKTAVPKAHFYHSRNNTLSMFVTDREELDALLKRAGSTNIEVEYGAGIFTPQYHISVMECPRYASTPDEIYDTLNHVLECHTKHENGKVIWIDESIIKEKNYRKDVLGVLTRAVQNSAFNVVYQPIYSTKDKRFTSAEALVRLQDCGEMGFISPEVFIPLAEQYGMISEIGNIVFEKVCSFAAENRLWEKGINYIEVNLSGMQSVDPSLPEQLAGVMEAYGINPKFINLEITETASIDGGDLLDMNMQQLRKLGCHFSMDDFGTGYSNLSQMAKVRFELVKLDKSLIWPAFGENPEEPLVILNSCIAMILQLGSHIVAEGVETEEQASFLAERGVHYLQGYFYSKPVPGSRFLEIIASS